MKTRERTEGAATVVQAMHGDSCSATRVDPDPMCSTSFGDDCTGPPTPPCSGENALVDNGAAAPKSCPPSSEMRSPTAAGGLLPTGKASLATRTTPLSTSHLFGSTRPRKQILRRLRLHTSRATAVTSKRITFLLLPSVGGPSWSSSNVVSSQFARACMVTR